jgi:hypothetical protein
MVVARSSDELRLEFCPGSFETEAREVLHLGKSTSIKLDELLLELEELDIYYEKSKIDKTPLGCDTYDPELISIAYKVYAGFDDTREYTRNYLILADEKGIIRYIDNRYSYKIPPPY